MNLSVFSFESKLKTSNEMPFFKWTKNVTLTAFIGLIGYSSPYNKIRAR